MTMNHQVNLEHISFLAKDLRRPECILATYAGNFYVSDFRGGVTQICADGSTIFYGKNEVEGIGELKPNGICLLKDGSFLVAHLGDTTGGIYKIGRDSKVEPYLTHLDGKPLPPSNFIYLDHQDRLWLTVSTRIAPRAQAYRKDVSDGFIAVIDKHGAKIVADGIGYTNEIVVTPDGQYLYVNATFARQTLKFTINNDNSLSDLKTVASYGEGIFPDGLTLDTQGYLWVTSIISNSVLRVCPHSAEVSTIVSDADAEHLHYVEKAYQSNSLGRNHLDVVRSKKLKNISSLAFAGRNLNRIYLGCLLGESIAYFDSHFEGEAPAHWYFDS